MELFPARCPARTCSTCLFRPGDFIEFGHYYGANGGLEATIAPVPLPLGAPLLLGSVAMLMAASKRRK